MIRGRRIVVTSVAAGVALACSALLAPVALAVPRTESMSDGLALLKARDHLAIQRRLDVLAALTRRVDAAIHLAASDRSTLLSQYSAADGGLRALDEKIQSDSTVAAVRADQTRIVTDYHVYVLVVPKTHIVIAADRISYIASEFASLVSKLQAAIDEAKADEKNTTAAQNAFDDMQAKVQDAMNVTAGIPGRVLPLEASGYPDNRSTLLGARSDLVTARTDLRAARADVVKVIQALS